MSIRAISSCFLLISLISCQSSQTEVNEPLHDTTVKIADTTPVISDSIDTGSQISETPEGPDSNYIRNKMDQGIDFFAAGNEPFWSLDMDFEKEFTFTAIGGSTLTIPATHELKSKKTNIKLYQSKSDSGEIAISLLKKECINSMSGAKSTYQVVVRVKSISEKDFIEYRGCGRFTRNDN